jgi:RecB family exonuclease
MTQCQARWFFEREAGGTNRTTQAQGFGNVVHALADRIGRGDLPADPAVVDELMEHVDRVWEQIPFRTPWSAGQQRVEVEAALTRFIAFHNRPDARTLIATEHEFGAEVTLPDGERVALHGYADRLEVDSEGRVVVVDLKTGKYPADDVRTNPQLGLYQLAVDHDAVADLAGNARAGGAELWQLRQQSRGKVKVQEQPPQTPDDAGHTPVQVQLMTAARAIREESFLAMPGTHCDRCDFQRMCPATTSSTVLH